MHDPMQTYAMQTYAALGGYPGVTSQFGLPQQGLQTLAMQPGLSPLLQGQGISPFAQGVGISPFQQNNPYQNPLLQNPFVAGLQNPLAQQWQNPLQQLQQNPLQQIYQQNPLLQHAIQAQIQAQLVAQQLAAQQLAAQQLAAQQLAAQQMGLQPFGIHSPQVSPFAHSGVPYGQVGQFGQSVGQWGQGITPLAPQTWVGQGGQLGGYGQINPLAQLAGRGQYAPGIAPWAGY
jgi:hypothetical protein